MDANSKQIGGTHYKQGGEFQHWDLIERYGIGYLEGYASKELVRLGKKNDPIEELEKAKHITQKLIELTMEGVRQPRGRVPFDVLMRFYELNGITNKHQQAAIMGLCDEWTVGLLHIVVSNINQLIEQHKKPPHVDNTGQKNPFGYDHNEESA